MRTLIKEYNEEYISDMIEDQRIQFEQIIKYKLNL